MIVYIHMYVYIYIYIHMCVYLACMYIYIYMYLHIDICRYTAEAYSDDEGPCAQTLLRVYSWPCCSRSEAAVFRVQIWGCSVFVNNPKP